MEIDTRSKSHNFPVDNQNIDDDSLLLQERLEKEIEGKFAAKCICNHADPNKCYPITRCACKVHRKNK